MSKPENAGLRIVGEAEVQRIGTGVEEPVLFDLPCALVTAQPNVDRQPVLDPRRGRRGQVLHVATDPAEPAIELDFLSVPPRLLAMLMLGAERALSVAGGTVSAPEGHAGVVGFGVRTAHANIGSVLVYAGVRATLATGVVGSDNAITWTAVAPGAAGNSITVALVNPGTNTAALAVTVTGTAIVVSLETDGAAAAVSTAAEVMAAVQASAAASALVTVADTDTSDGSGVVAAAVAAPLASGSNTGTALVAGTDYEIGNQQTGVVRLIAGGALGDLGDAAQVWMTYTYGAITGTAVEMGTETTVEVSFRLIGLNDQMDQDGESGRPLMVVAPRLQLQPRATINLVGAAVAQAQFSAVPLVPADGSPAFDVQFARFGAPG